MSVFGMSSMNTEARRSDANVFGDVEVKGKNEHILFTTIYVEGTKIGTPIGHYMLIDLQPGTLKL